MSAVTRRTAGRIGFATGVSGAVAAAVLLAWPAQAPGNLVSYPFTTTGFRVAQLSFFLHHIGLVVVVVAFVRAAPFGAGWFSRAGGWLAVAGTVALTWAELFALRYAEWDIDLANEGAMGAAYGVACTAIGVGMLAAGVGTVRSDTWHGWRAWTPLVIGVTQFVVLTPGMFGGFVVARLAIGFWMLTFAALGWSLATAPQRGAPIAAAV